ncbi:MAG: response regulator [Ruminococcus sp.]|jgi:signal transduction histidine kinase/FixJ family two-component response regulator/GGDEF domain-containing protein|nr:response regulator [Ruminococcus sp.]
MKLKKSRTLLHRILAPLLAATLLQMIVLSLIVVCSGIPNELNDKSAENINGQLLSASLVLAASIDSKTPDFTELIAASDRTLRYILKTMYINEISASEEANFLNSNKDKERFISLMYEDLIKAGIDYGASASFIIMADSADEQDPDLAHSFPAVMAVRPSHTSNTLSLLRGSRAIAVAHNLPLDASHHETIKYSPGDNDASRHNMDFFWKPFLAAKENPAGAATDLGYFSFPFYLERQSGAQSMIAVSIPLRLGDRVIGVLGYCFTTEEIFTEKIKQMQYDTPHAQNASLLLASFENRSVDEFEIEENSPLNITPKFSFDAAHISYETGNVIDLIPSPEFPELLVSDKLTYNGEEAVAAVSDLNVYNAVSAYNSERWGLVLVSSQSEVFSLARSVSWIFGILIFLSTLDAVLMAVFATRGLTGGIKKIADGIRPDGVIPVIDNDSEEIYKLSRALSEAAIQRELDRAEIQAEHERFRIALLTCNQHFIDYDVESDTLVLDLLTDGKIVQHIYERFLDRLLDLDICLPEDITTVAEFMRGQVSETITRSVKAFDGTWHYIRSRPYYIYDDTSGKLIRTIACLSDVTDEKKLDTRYDADTKHDLTTGFIKSEYGIHAAREYLGIVSPDIYAAAALIIVNFRYFTDKYGRFFSDALMYETARIIRKYIRESFVITRESSNEISIIGQTETDVKAARRQVKTAIDKIIAESYALELSDKEPERIEIKAGIYINNEAKSIPVTKHRAEYALAAAVKNITGERAVFWVDADADYDFSVKEDIYSIIESVSVSDSYTVDSSDLSTFTFNILEKTSDINSAIQMLLGRFGEDFGFSRVLMYTFDRIGLTFTLSWQWNTYGKEKTKKTSVSVSVSARDEFSETLSGTDFIIIDNTSATFPEFFRASLQIAPGDAALVIPCTDGVSAFGCVVFEAEKSQIDSSDFDEIAANVKLLSAYFSKSRSTTESKAKSDFLSKMSHEIRTPMNAIIGMTTIAMKDKENTPKQADYLKKIDYSAKYLLSLINDILDMSRIESGKIKTEITVCDLDEILGGLDSIIGSQCETRGIKYTVKDSAQFRRFLSDPLKLNQIFMNLLGNSVKFTEPGGEIIFTVSSIDDIGEKKSLFFSVRDTGIGIRRERLERIFEAFEQEDVSTARQYGGTGLGLPIASSYAAMLDGELKVDSEPGRGTEFYFTIPVEPVNESAASPQTSAPTETAESNFKGKHILVAEDDELNTEIAKTLLEAEGFIVTCAENGAIALKLFTESKTNTFDAILMDIRMPIMNGLEATSRIRHSERPDAKSIPIIALSANAFPEDIENSKNAGMTDHVIKPLDMRVLMGKLRKMITQKTEDRGQKTDFERSDFS